MAGPTRHRLPELAARALAPLLDDYQRVEAELRRAEALVLGLLDLNPARYGGFERATDGLYVLERAPDAGASEEEAP